MSKGINRFIISIFLKIVVLALVGIAIGILISKLFLN